MHWMFIKKQQTSAYFATCHHACLAPNQAADFNHFVSLLTRCLCDHAPLLAYIKEASQYMNAAQNCCVRKQKYHTNVASRLVNLGSEYVKTEFD